MKPYRKTTAFLNPTQVTVDVSDEPLYARCKEIQWFYPQEYGKSTYFPLMGGFHIEKVRFKESFLCFPIKVLYFCFYIMQCSQIYIPLDTAQCSSQHCTINENEIR